jgi:hypothetical protein
MLNHRKTTHRISLDSLRGSIAALSILGLVTALPGLRHAPTRRRTTAAGPPGSISVSTSA